MVHGHLDATVAALVAAFALFVVVSCSDGEGASSNSAALSECAGIGAAPARLDCYDRLAGRSATDASADDQVCLGPKDPREPGSCISTRGERICPCSRDGARFVVDPAGETVKDQVTGLTWQVADSRNENPVTNGRRKFAEAADYCAQLALAGGGWRVPTLDEGLVMIDEEHDRYLCAARCPFSDRCGVYWTSTIERDEQAYTIDQSNGSEAIGVTDSDVFLVRCVR